MIPEPNETDLARDAEREYTTDYGGLRSQAAAQAWIRRAVAAEAKVAAWESTNLADVVRRMKRLEAELAKAVAAERARGT